MKTAYLAGPMRGLPQFNFPAFDGAAKVLREANWTIFSPAERDREHLDVSQCPTGSNEELEAQGFSLAGALSWDFARIMESDAVIVLPGWESSTGVHWELTVAYALGKNIYAFSSPTQYPRWFWLDPLKLPQCVTDPTVRPAEWEPIRVPGAGTVGEVRVTDPATGGQKGQKLARFDLLPWDVLTELAEHYGKGSQKYEDRNWQKSYSWSLSIGALCRHLAAWLAGEDDDPETGSCHLVAVIWHAIALRWFQKHGKGTDDRYKETA